MKKYSIASLDDEVEVVDTISANFYEVDRNGVACFYTQESECDRPVLIASIPANRFTIAEKEPA